MDIITAIKSGRPYKRAHMKAYITFDTDDSFSGEDILATDWETEEPKVEIMESEFWEAACTQLAATMATQGISLASPAGKEREIMMNQLQTVLLKQMAEQLFGKNAPLKGAGEK